MHQPGYSNFRRSTHYRIDVGLVQRANSATRAAGLGEEERKSKQGSAAAGKIAAEVHFRHLGRTCHSAKCMRPS